MTDAISSLAAAAARRGLRFEIVGNGRPLLMLHGGGGPATLRAFAQRIAGAFTVILPTHPGFDGTERPAEMTSVRALARVYGDLLAEAQVKDLVVMGFSLGGWLAAELAAAYPAQVASLLLVDAVGIAAPGEVVLNVNGMPPSAIADHSYHRPDAFRIDPASMSPETLAAMKANFATLAVYAEDHYMQDPGLLGRLNTIAAETLVLWGESDRVVYPAYGRAYANAIPGALFQIIPECGHLPQLEQPALLQQALQQFVAS